MSSLLYAQEYKFSDSNPDSPLCVMLHGLFGMSSNLLGLGKALSPTCLPVLYDLPNHGLSPTMNPCDFILMAQLLDQSIERVKRSPDTKVHLLGHSLGGKLAMVYSLLYPHKTDSLAVLDIAPVTYPPFHAEIIVGMKEVIKKNPRERSEVVEILKTYTEDQETTTFLAKSFILSDAEIISKIRVQEIEQNYETLKSFPTSEMKGKHYMGEVLFLRGEDTPYFSDEYLELVEYYFPSYEIDTISQSGHNIHIDNLQETKEALLYFYSQIS